MVAAAGNRVEALHRERIGGLMLPAALVEGAWQWLGESDLAALRNASATEPDAGKREGGRPLRGPSHVT